MGQKVLSNEWRTEAGTHRRDGVLGGTEAVGHTPVLQALLLFTGGFLTPGVYNEAFYVVH